MLILPIRVGISAPLLLVIYAIGLWDAWKFTAPVRLAISGPFQAAPPPPPVLPATPQPLPPVPPVPQVPPTAP